MVLQNRRVTIHAVARPLPVSHGSAYETIHNRLAFLKICIQWVPKQLELHEQKRLDIFKRVLDRCGAEGDNFLERIVMGDKTWIHHYKPDSECQSVEWKYPHLPARRKLKTHPTAGKLMLIVFGDSQGLVLEQYQESVQQCTVLTTVGCCVTS
jgi:hypothetical protein